MVFYTTIQYTIARQARPDGLKEITAAAATMSMRGAGSVPPPGGRGGAAPPASRRAKASAALTAVGASGRPIGGVFAGGVGGGAGRGKRKGGGGVGAARSNVWKYATFALVCMVSSLTV